MFVKFNVWTSLNDVSFCSCCSYMFFGKMDQSQCTYFYAEGGRTSIPCHFLSSSDQDTMIRSITFLYLFIFFVLGKTTTIKSFSDVREA